MDWSTCLVLVHRRQKTPLVNCVIASMMTVLKFLQLQPAAHMRPLRRVIRGWVSAWQAT